MAYIDKSGNIRSTAYPRSTVQLAFPVIPRATNYYVPRSSGRYYKPHISSTNATTAEVGVPMIDNSHAVSIYSSEHYVSPYSYTHYSGPYRSAPYNNSTTNPSDYIVDVLGNLPINTKYLSNTTNGFAINSFADALLNIEAKHRKWKGTSLDPRTFDGAILNYIIPIGVVVDSLGVLKNTIWDPIQGSIEMANESDTDDFEIWDAVKAGTTTAVLNTLINIGNTLDIVSNPIKGFVLEGFNSNKKGFDGVAATYGFARGFVGDPEYGRKQYDYADYVDDKLSAFGLEIISDPLNLISLGGKSAVSAGAKGVASIVDDALGAVTEVVSKGVTKEVVEEIAEQGVKTLTKEATEEVVEEVIEQGIKTVSDTATDVVEDSTKNVIKKLVPEIVEEVSPETLETIAKEFGSEAAEQVIKDNAVTKSATKYVVKDTGEDAADAIVKAISKRGYTVSKDTVTQLLEEIITDAPIDEVLKNFTKGARSSLISTLKRLAQNPELAKELLGNSVKQAKWKELLGIPKLDRLPSEVGEAAYQQLSKSRSLRGVAAKASNKIADMRHWTPTAQKFSGELIRKYTLENMPGLMKASRLYNNAEFVDALIRNIAFQGAGVYLPTKFGIKAVKKGLGYANNLKAHKFAGEVKNTTDWLLDNSPNHAVDFNAHGDVVHVKISSSAKIKEAPNTTVELSFKVNDLKAVDDVLNTQRDALLTRSFLNDSLDVTGLQSLYDGQRAVLDAVVSDSKVFKELNINSFEDLVKYLNRVDTDDAVMLAFIKKLNDTYNRLTKKVTVQDLDVYVDALKNIAKLADYEGVSTVTDNLELQNIITNSAISRNLVAARDAEAFKIASKQRADALKNLEAAKKSLTESERATLLKYADRIADEMYVDEHTHLIKEIDRLLNSTYKNYPNTTARAALLGDTYDDFIEALDFYKAARKSLAEAMEATPNVESEILIKEMLELDAAVKLTEAYDVVYKRLNNIDFTADTFKQAVGARPELNLPEFDVLPTKTITLDNFYNAIARKSFYFKHPEFLQAPRVSVPTTPEAAQMRFILNKIEARQNPVDMSKLWTYVQKNAIDGKASLSSKISLPDGLKVHPDGLIDVNGKVYFRNSQVDKADVAVAMDEAYAAYNSTLADYMLTANAGNIKLNTLEGYVRSLDALPKEVFGAQARLNSVDIDSVAQHQLVGYVLGLSKRGMLMSVLKGEGTEGRYFAQLLDDYDAGAVDEEVSVIRRLINQDFSADPKEVTTYSDYEYLYETAPDVIRLAEEKGFEEGSLAFKEFLAEQGYIKKSTIVKDISIYKDTFDAFGNLLDRLSKTRSLLTEIENTLSVGLDPQHVSCFMDEFISRGLESPNALLPENISKTITDCFEGSEIKLGSILDVPKLTQDYNIADIILKYTTGPNAASLTAELDSVQRIALDNLQNRQAFSHDSLVDVENWIDAFVKLNPDNKNKLKALTKDGRHIVVLDIETTGLLEHKTSEIYQIAAKIIDADGNQISQPLKLRVRVKDMPDTPVLNKLFQSADPEELTALKEYLGVENLTAEEWFTHTYLKDHYHPFDDTVWLDQKGLTTKKALGRLWDYIGEAQRMSSTNLAPIIAGHNIKEFDIQMLYNKAYLNTPLRDFFDEANKHGHVFDTLDLLQDKQFWRVGSELINSYTTQLSNIVSVVGLPNHTLRQSVFGFSDVETLSEFKSILKESGLGIQVSDIAKATVNNSKAFEAFNILNEDCTNMRSLLNDTIFEHRYSYEYFDFIEFAERYVEALGDVSKRAADIGVSSTALITLTHNDAVFRKEIQDVIKTISHIEDGRLITDPDAFEIYFEETKGKIIDRLERILKEDLDIVEREAAKHSDILQTIVNEAAKYSPSAKAFSGTSAELVEFIESAVEEVNNQWRAVSKLRGSTIVYTFSKAGLGPEKLFELWQEGLVSVPGWRNIMSMVFHDTDARGLTLLNPRTLYSYVFENFYDKELVKNIYGTGDANKFVSSKVLEELTENSKRMSRIKKGILPSYTKHYYDTAYSLLDKAKNIQGKKTTYVVREANKVITREGVSVKHMYDLTAVNLDKLPKANLLAYTVANYDDLHALFKFYKDEDALNKLKVFKDFNSLHKALPEEVTEDALGKYSILKRIKTRTVSTLDENGNLMNIYTGKYGSYEDLSGVMSNAHEDAELTLKEILQFNDDRHLHSATKQANASLYRAATTWQDEVNRLFENTGPEQREQYFKQIYNVDEVYSKAALDNLLKREDAVQHFIEEARLSAGRKAFFSENEIDLTAFIEQGVIVKVVPKTLEDGTSGYLHLLAVPVELMPDIFILNRELDATVLETLEDLGVNVVKTTVVEDNVTTYKYVFNNATELSKEITDAKIIDDIEAAPELKQLITEWRLRDAAHIKNIGYSTGDVLNRNIVDNFDELLGVEAKRLMSSETLKAFGFFDDLKANNLVIGAWGVQNIFNKYACSDFVRRHAYTTVNYIDTQLSNVTRYLNMLCNNENGMDTAEWLKNLDAKDLYEVLKDNKDLTLVYVRPSGKFSKTSSGFVVERLNVVNVKSIELARNLNAHLIPTYSAYTIMQAVNDFKLPPILRVAQNISTLFKVGYLSSIGWLVRNFIDSNYKNHLDFKGEISITEQVQGLFNTMRLLMDYTKTLQGVGRTLDDIAEYKALYHLCKDTPDDLVKLIESNPTMARYIKRFQSSLSEESLAEINKHLIDVNLFELTDLFIKNGPSAGIPKSIVNAIPNTNSATQKIVNFWTTNRITGTLFNTNELIEQSARLQSYLYALRSGASLDEAVARVIKTHFDYSDKSLAMLYTELIFPFMSFSFKNLEYWIDTMYSNGFVVGELENVLRSVLDYHSLFNPDYEVYRNYDYRFDFEKDVLGHRANQPWQLIDAARLYHKLNGNIVWDTGKDVKYDNGFEIVDADLHAVFKLSPSILDAVNMLFTPLSQFEQRMLPPYEVLLTPIKNALAGEDINLREVIAVDSLLNNLPFIGAVLQRTGLSYDGEHKPNNIIQRMKDAGLYQGLSSLFTAAYVKQKKYNTWYGEDDEYLTKLPPFPKRYYPKNYYPKQSYTRTPYYRSGYNKTYNRQGGFTVNYPTARRQQDLYNLDTPRYRMDTLARSPYYKDNYSKPKKQVLRTNYYSSLTYNVLADNILKKRVLDKFYYT